jgi:hypothetical protein
MARKSLHRLEPRAVSFLTYRDDVRPALGVNAGHHDDG